MDYLEFCKHYFSATNIPISLSKNHVPVYASIADTINMDYLAVTEEEILCPITDAPTFCHLDSDIEYGRVHAVGTEYTLYIGPIFNIPLTPTLLRRYMNLLSVPLQFFDHHMELLGSVPQLTHLQFVRHLAFIHYCINQQIVDLETLFTNDQVKFLSINEKHMENHVDVLESQQFHSSYEFETKLYQYIREGNTEKLQKFLFLGGTNFAGGLLASSALRQAKNIFISLVSKIAVMAAIPGGMDTETVYQLTDLYIRECEQLQAIDSIHTLQYAMIFDFCKRVHDVQIPGGFSKEIYDCINFTRSHTNENIRLEDVAAHIDRSVSYVTRKFKQELGINLNDYIMRCKLEEAKSLLTFSNMSLVQISAYLCFSSQSYFQNVFKKKFGLTPLQYRNKTIQNKTHIR